MHRHARLAQLVERKALNLVVVGSSPTVGVYFLCSPRSDTSDKVSDMILERHCVRVVKELD